MDTSEKYIKMCEKAEEIQKEIRLYDVYAFMTEHEKYKIGVYGGERIFKATFLTGAIFLPRQDQLQEMILPELRKQQKYTHAYTKGQNAEGFIATCLIADFNSWLDRMFPWLKQEQCNSMEQLWLAFVMKEKFNKTWNDEKEEWTEL